jgi:hypothetical protein
MGAALVLSACASITDTPNQQVQVLTPGAQDSRCVLRSPHVRYVVYPPQTILMRRDNDPLKIVCTAPGNREKVAFAYPRLNGSVTTNLALGGLGGLYDHVSGALYEYPNPIVVDFRRTTPSDRALPGYHNDDTMSPFDQAPEDLRDQPAPFPSEVREGLDHPPFPLKPKKTQDKNTIPSLDTTLTPATAPSKSPAKAAPKPNHSPPANVKPATPL